MGMTDEPDDKSWDQKNFTEKLWTLDEQTLIQRFIAGRQQRDTGDAHTALVILQAKASIATQEAAKQSERVASYTKWLAIGTFVMAAATVILAVVQIF